MNLEPSIAITTGLSELFTTSTTPSGHLRVRTPFYYPDGGIVDVFVIQRSSGFDVTDFGEALGWLRLQTISGRQSPKQLRLIQDICLTLGIEFFRTQLIVRSKSYAELAQTVLRLAQAVVRVSDLWFTTRTGSVESMTDEVADLFSENVVQFERGVKLAGRSGRSWTVDFQTRTDQRTALISVLSTGSRAAAKRVAEHVVAVWHDLSHLRAVGPQLTFISLFDDTADVWSDEDFKLVDDLSEVQRWSRPDELMECLKVAS